MAKRGTLTLRREDGRIVCEHVRLADTYADAAPSGCSGGGRCRPGDGVALRPSFSIHTAFMRFPIDVIFLDGDLVVTEDRRAPSAFPDRVVPRGTRDRRARRG